MEQPDLFKPPPPDRGLHQKCAICGYARWATIDMLRVAGWTAYDGVSLTGKTLNVRICPECRTRTWSAA